MVVDITQLRNLAQRTRLDSSVLRKLDVDTLNRLDVKRSYVCWRTDEDRRLGVHTL